MRSTVQGGHTTANPHPQLPLPLSQESAARIPLNNPVGITYRPEFTTGFEVANAPGTQCQVYLAQFVDSDRNPRIDTGQNLFCPGFTGSAAELWGPGEMNRAQELTGMMATRKLTTPGFLRNPDTDDLYPHSLPPCTPPSAARQNSLRHLVRLYLVTYPSPDPPLC